LLSGLRDFDLTTHPRQGRKACSVETLSLRYAFHPVKVVGFRITRRKNNEQPCGRPMLRLSPGSQGNRIPVMKEMTSNREKKFLVEQPMEAFPLESASEKRQFVMKVGRGKSYVVSENLKTVIELFTVPRSMREAAEELSRRQSVFVSEDQLLQAVSKYIDRHGILREASEIDPAAVDDNGAGGRPSKGFPTGRKNRAAFDFTLRLPLISPKISLPVVNRLTWLFDYKFATLATVAIIFAHLAFYLNWFSPRPRLSFGPTAYIVFYSLTICTVLFHELGHAAACKKYGCEYGHIGFLIYIILPAFYVNLSNAWRLPRKQRAVIDAGGIYFQSLLVVPLFLLFLLTKSQYFSGVIYAVDAMAIFSLNPLFKFDGYWLLVDLTGMVNLHRRAWRTVKDVLFWSLGIAKVIPIFEEVTGVGNRLLLIVYSFISLLLFSALIVFVLLLAPAKIMVFLYHLRAVFLAPANGPSSTLARVGRTLLDLFFLLFSFRMIIVLTSRLFKKDTWRKSV
jgi:hypothetical protein